MKSPALVVAAALALGACSLAGDITPPPGLATAQALGTGLPPTEAPMAVPQRSPDIVAGKPIFAEKCAPCHGEAGLGDGPQAAALPNPPSALANLQVAQDAVPADWYRVVTEGRLDAFMPGFASLDDGQRWDVVGYALSLGLPADEVEAGRQVYQQSCASCHGQAGQGTSGSPDLASAGFQSTRSLQAIYGAVTDGKGQGMPAFADSLSESERRSVVAYVRSLGLSSGSAAPPAPTPTAVAPTAPGTPAVATPGGEPTSESSPTAGAALGTVTGTISNGTGGAAVPAGQEVILHGFDGDQEALTTSTTAGADGRFTFTGIEPVAGRNYVATADYQGVLYASAIAAFPGNTPALDLPLTVYETTADIGAVQVGRLHLVFDFASDGVVQVLELWLLSNTGDRTVFSADQGLIDITLPEGASGLSFDGGTVGDRFELTPTGFRDRRELVPGENTGEIIFSYNLPYDGSSKLDRQAPYPVMATVAMVSGEGPQVSGDGFTDMGLRQVSGMSLHTYQRGPARAGETISLELSGHPTAAAAPSTSTRVAPVIAAAAALALALIAAALIWFRPWRRTRRPAPATEQAGDEDAALWAIASLDNEFAEGKIDPASYQARRAELIRRAQEASHRD